VPTPNVCGNPGCCPKNCIEQGFDCGMASTGAAASSTAAAARARARSAA
jgi:hypothetical protein